MKVRLMEGPEGRGALAGVTEYPIEATRSGRLVAAPCLASQLRLSASYTASPITQRSRNRSITMQRLSSILARSLPLDASQAASHWGTLSRFGDDG